ncbi:hypothetical protein BH20VER1_BH20VER1_24720 [soil metagenome]|jgi:hypothetical protein
MEILAVISMINQMRAAGVIERYAIGGAVGATFHIEPVSTLDVDIFAAFEPTAGSLLITPQPIFDYLTARGCSVEGEYIIIGGWPVQFLPAGNRLVEEALAEAVTMHIGNTPASVCTAEHLAAIALQLGRGKDKARLLQFVEAGVLETDRLQSILTRHNLMPAWERFSRQFLTET